MIKLTRLKQAAVNLKIFHTPGCTRFLLALLSIDALFILAHLAYVFLPQVTNENLDIGTDRGYGEWFQYLKWCALIIAFMLLVIRRKDSNYLGWAVFITYLLLDDAFMVHETLGGEIASHLMFSPPWGLRLQDIGEVIVSCLVAVPLLIVIDIAYRRGRIPFVKASQDMLLLLVGLAFCGIGFDLAHFIVKLGRYVTVFLEIVEDGGEMIMTSLMLWYVSFLLRDRELPEKTICRSIWDGLQTSINSQRT